MTSETLLKIYSQNYTNIVHHKILYKLIFWCRKMFSSSCLLRRYQKAFVNIKDLLKYELKLFYTNVHTNTPYVNFRKAIFCVQFYALLQFGWNLSTLNLMFYGTQNVNSHYIISKLHKKYSCIHINFSLGYFFELPNKNERSLARGGLPFHIKT